MTSTTNKNSSFLVDDNYGNFHSVNKLENDIDYCRLSILACYTDVTHTRIESLFCVTFKDTIPIYLAL